GNVDHIWMPQAACRARFALEARDKLFIAHELRRDQFQRDVTLGAEVHGQIHRAHAALPEKALQTILFVQNLTDVTFEWCHVNKLSVPAGLGPGSLPQLFARPKVFKQLNTRLPTDWFGG